MATDQANDDARRLLDEAPCFSVLAAGAGKTELLARCCAVSPDDARRTLLLTHTNAGVEVLRRRIALVGGDPRRTHVATIAGWCEALCRRYPLLAGWADLESEESRDYHAIYAGAATVLESHGIRRMLSASWSAALVDEYQDCSKDQHGVVVALNQSIPTIVVGDPLQSIYTFEGEPVDWDDDVAGAWPQVEISTVPRRWQISNPSLGADLAVVRESLLNGRSVDLSTLAEIRWTPQNYVNEVTRPKAMGEYSGSCLVVVAFPPQAVSLAKKCGGIFGTLEKLATSDLIDFARLVDEADAPGPVISALFALAQGAMAKLPAGFFARGAQIASGGGVAYQQASKLGPLTAAALCYRNSGAIQDLANLVVAIRSMEGIVIARQELWNDIELAIISAANRSSVSASSASTEIRERARRRGRRPASHVIGTTLLAKGLEYDHVIVTKAHLMNAENLYVAMTRATTSLEVLSESPMIDPHDG